MQILDKGNSFIIFLVGLSYILEIFAILVFQENIELNFKGFNENTKKNIQKRADNEQILSSMSNDNDNDNDESFNEEEEEQKEP